MHVQYIPVEFTLKNCVNKFHSQTLAPGISGSQITDLRKRAGAQIAREGVVNGRTDTAAC